MLTAFLMAATISAGPVDPRLSSEMRWRMIGPFRGGRTVAAVGVRNQPNVFYIGVNNGGVWKSTDAGRIWTPIFDEQPTGSIGAIAVAPSDPTIVYVGCGEGLQRPDLSTGDGMYKSTDAGKSWQHLGLRDGQQIPAIAVDPRDPNRLFVAVLGHPYGPNDERGIFRSSDGGRTFEKILYKDENTGGIDVIFDPSNSQTVYAALWQARQGPWENAAFSGPGSGLFKSTDGGTTWKQLTAGLPSAKDGLGRIGLDVSASNPSRLYAVVDATKIGGIYRSDDAGESWQMMNTDNRLWGRGGDFNEVRIDPKNPDVTYVANVVTWKSTDGGKTYASFRGAPGGDDYHRVWINPDDPNIILIASDQGAIITVNGGDSWSSWYNQPTAQFYHVSTDNDFPYRVCGGQQESGSACVQSRGDDGQITFREWHPVGIEEYGYAVPDPLNPNLVYGGKLERYDRRTGQVSQIAPMAIRDSSYRVIRTQPIVFSPADPHILYFASNTLWKTMNGGQSWTQISPDLMRKEWPVPANVGVYTAEAKPSQRGVIYAIAPSPLDVNRIWVGTDDGLIHLTTDGGKNWKSMTPKDLQPWAKVSIMDASHFDPLTAYAAINTFRLDDLRPHIYRTRDGGQSWTHITNGIPDGGIINVVREDPKRKGLLFAGSEQAVYMSSDDGDHWQSLRLNMPASSIRDLVIHEDDLVVATHGRGFWILDNITPLRGTPPSPAANAFLVKPAPAWRFRWNKNTDTPLPPDEPAGQNPPDGAIVDYYLPSAATGPVTLEILDGAGKLVRRYSSADKVEPPRDEGQVPWYWIRPPQVLSAEAGMHRFVWDLHYTQIPGGRRAYPIAAVFQNTPPVSASPWVMPGQYAVKLTANGQSMTQPLTVRMDPRVKTPAEGLQQQFALSKEMYDDILEVNRALEELRASRARMKAKSGEATAAFEKRAAALEGEEPSGFGGGAAPGAGKQAESINSLSGSLRTILGLLQGADVTPTAQVVAAVTSRRAAAADVLKRWKALQSEEPK
jgi:photosystem II stability/assembly factor-like uncharacterized protein